MRGRMLFLFNVLGGVRSISKLDEHRPQPASVHIPATFGPGSGGLWLKDKGMVVLGQQGVTGTILSLAGTD